MLGTKSQDESERLSLVHPDRAATDGSNPVKTILMFHAARRAPRAAALLLVGGTRLHGLWQIGRAVVKMDIEARLVRAQLELYVR